MRLKKKKLEILVDWDFNASAISRPAFGIVGPSTHYIRFGLPLLASLSEDQLRPVLAHELAHLSRNHPGFGTRIGRASTRGRTIRFCHHPCVLGTAPKSYGRLRFDRPVSVFQPSPNRRCLIDSLASPQKIFPSGKQHHLPKKTIRSRKSPGRCAGEKSSENTFTRRNAKAGRSSNEGHQSPHRIENLRSVSFPRSFGQQNRFTSRAPTEKKNALPREQKSVFQSFAKQIVIYLSAEFFSSTLSIKPYAAASSAGM